MTSKTMQVIAAEMERAEELKAEGKFEHTVRDSISNSMKLAILTEEIGEVAQTINDLRKDSNVTLHNKELRKELVQVAAVAAAWAEVLE